MSGTRFKAQGKVRRIAKSGGDYGALSVITISSTLGTARGV